MTNKVRASALGLRMPDLEATGPALHMKTLGTAAIRDDSETLRSKRYLASMVLQAEGWILSVNTPQAEHGPFASPEAAFDWWAEHRHSMPASTWTPWQREVWPPGIEEDWAEHEEP